MSAANSNKGEGAWEVQRSITAPALRDAADATGAVAAVNAIAGVRAVEVNVEKRRLIACYDARLTNYQEICATLGRAGYPAEGGRWSRLKESWFSFVDANLRENASAPPPACCNKPPRQRKP
jgi:hypothetical protein